MTEPAQPTPQRIGDSERDRAAELLREHMAQGRLSAEEFDERIEAALKAKVATDLDPLFSDLPGPRPGQDVATTPAFQAPPWQQPSTVAPVADPVPASRGDVANRVLTGLTAAMWPVTILLLFIIGWQYWWLIFIPVIISSVFGKDQHDRRERERERIEREQRRLDERRRRALGD